MKHKLLSLLMAVSLLLSLCPAALSAEELRARETSFYTDQHREETDRVEWVYRPMDADPVLEDINRLRPLLEDSGSVDAVLEGLEEIYRDLTELSAMESLAQDRSNQDAADPKAASELVRSQEARIRAWDAFVLLLGEILRSPCGEALSQRMTQEQAQYALTYRGVTEELLALTAQETMLKNEYLAAVEEGVSVQYGGSAWTWQQAVDAFAAGELSGAACVSVLEDLQAAQDDVLGNIYLRMVSLRREIAQVSGWGSYGDYAYADIYLRDYSQRDLRAFHAAVRAYLVPLFRALVQRSDGESAAFRPILDKGAVWELITPWVSEMSSELAQSLEAMRRRRPDAAGLLTDCAAPLLEDAADGPLGEFSAAAHQLGHYNHFYWSADSWPVAQGMELSEVHALGLELLLCSYCADLLGRDGRWAEEDLLRRLLESVVTGAMYDELEQFVYAAGEELTTEEINQAYARLRAEYGLDGGEAAPSSRQLWQQERRLFTDPCSYGGYAVSAAAALGFWQSAQEDFLPAVDQYLALTALPLGTGFQESFRELALPSPLRPAFLEGLAGCLMDRLELAEEPEVLLPAPAFDGVSFTDVRPDSWYGRYVLTLAELGLVKGYDDGSFRPSQSATVDDAYRALLGEDYASEDGGEPITRLYFCQLMALSLGLALDQPAGFSDTDDPSVALLSSRGVINGYADGSFHPDEPLSRAELCACLYRVFYDAIAAAGL